MDKGKATLKQAKRLITLVIGGTVVLGGVILLFIPGPGIAAIAAGLAILATEFVWARRLLQRVREEGDDVAKAVKKKWKREKGEEQEGEKNGTGDKQRSE